MQITVGLFLIFERSLSLKFFIAKDHFEVEIKRFRDEKIRLESELTHAQRLVVDLRRSSELNESRCMEIERIRDENAQLSEKAADLKKANSQLIRQVCQIKLLSFFKFVSIYYTT